MHKNCHPIISRLANRKEFICFGGEPKPYQHDKIWVKLPLHFEEPDNLAELHDEFLERWPEGGYHKHKPPQDPKEESRPQASIAIKLDGTLLEKLTLFAARVGYNRSVVLRSLVLVLFTTDEQEAMSSFKTWRKLVAKHLT